MLYDSLKDSYVLLVRTLIRLERFRSHFWRKKLSKSAHRNNQDLCHFNSIHVLYQQFITSIVSIGCSLNAFYCNGNTESAMYLVEIIAYNEQPKVNTHAGERSRGAMTVNTTMHSALNKNT